MATQTAPAVSPKEAATIAKEGYFFGLPLVYVGLQIDVSTSVSKPEGMKAPMGQFANVREFPDAENNPIVGMNVDTLYSFGNLNVKEEPYILSVPDTGKRFWIMQVIDAWNDVPAAPGIRTAGNKATNFALVGPGWKGKLPDGVTRVDVDSNLFSLGGRTFTGGKADYAEVHKIQDQYKLTPLSKWGSNYTPPATASVKPGVDTKTPITKQIMALSAEDFFNRFCALLVDNPAREADKPMMAQFEKLGIKPGAKFSLSAFDAETQTAIKEGVATAQKEIMAGHDMMGEKINGWQLARDLGRYGTKYKYRAIWTFFAIGGNLVEDAFYPFGYADSDGNALTGANKYELKFSKDEIPPVNYFWSLTIYDKDSFLVPNPLKRYALGDRDKMKYGDDGSLTLYIQRESPGADKESNWLPAPEGQLFAAMRLYGPKESVASGKWVPPAIKKVG